MKKIRFSFNYKYALAAALLLLIFGPQSFRSLVSSYREYRSLTARKAVLLRQRDDLKRQLAEVRGSPVVEQAARRELGLIRPGETIYSFPPPKDSDR